LRKPVSPGTTNDDRTRLAPGLRYAWEGIVHVLRTQYNARVHVGAAIVVLLAAIALRLSALELALVIVCIVSVIVTEMINTVVESIVDLVTSSYHPLAKIAKDVAAGAVLVSAGGSVLVGLLVMVPHLWHLLHG